MAYYSPIILILVSVIFSVVIFRLTKIQEKQNQEIESLQGSINAICSGAVGVGEHLSLLDERSRLLMERQEKIELNENSNRNYKFAQKMVKKGAKLEDVIEDCGLAHGEAELVLLANRFENK